MRRLEREAGAADDATVWVCAEIEGWSVHLAGVALLFTSDQTEAFDRACAIHGEGRAQRILMVSGPSARRAAGLDRDVC